MKYQLLLLTIYLITVYSQKACNTYTTKATCDEDDNCEWEEANPGSCTQTTEKDCSKLTGENCKEGCTLSESGTCANPKTAAQCTAAIDNCGETKGCSAGGTEEAPTCTPTTGSDICKGTTQVLCEGEEANACAWTDTSTCSNSCTKLDKTNCGTGSNTHCAWTGEKAGSCNTVQEGGSKGGSGSGSGSGSGTGTGTGTGTGNGADSDSSNNVKFGNYLLVLFLFLF